MTTTLQQEIQHWQTDLQGIADTSTTDNWFLEERRFAEAQQTITAYRNRILPTFRRQQPHDVILTPEIEHLIDHLEDETIAALRALTRVALRLDQTLEDAR